MNIHGKLVTETLIHGPLDGARIKVHPCEQVVWPASFVLDTYGITRPCCYKRSLDNRLHFSHSTAVVKKTEQ